MAISDYTATWALTCLQSSQMSQLRKVLLGMRYLIRVNECELLLMLARLHLDEKVKVHFQLR